MQDPHRVEILECDEQLINNFRDVLVQDVLVLLAQSLEIKGQILYDNA